MTNDSILIVAFHFPPIATSSGVQRALKVVRYLREDGWRPAVLTVHPRAYAKSHPGQLGEIPADVPVHRAFGLDARRHFAIKGRYPGCLAWPDPWVSWWPAAVLSGMWLIRRYRPKIIWSTFPITTTNLVAFTLARWSGLPWVADLRDPITLEGYPRDPMRFRWARWVERKTVAAARTVVFTSEYTRKDYEERYPELVGRTELIPNGYDEANYPDTSATRTGDGARLTLVHSGALQPEGRNPASFFEALRMLKDRGKVDASTLRVVLRASAFEGRYGELAERHGVADLVELGAYLPYEQAIREMVEADGLLLFQGTAYNHAVPAKIYEYLFARRPIFALVDERGETQRVLNEIGIGSTARIDDAADIAARLERFLLDVRSGEYRLPETAVLEQYSRRRQTLRLSALLRQIVTDAARRPTHSSSGGERASPSAYGDE